MEAELKSLVALGNEANRAKYVTGWKKQGKKVAGLLCSYIPEEIIHAAGMLPWRVFGTWQSGTPHANKWRTSDTCLYCNHVLEALLIDKLDFLDVVIATDWDQELVRLWDVWCYLKKTPHCLIIDVPIVNTDTAVKFSVKQLIRFCQEIEAIAGMEISEKALENSIKVYETTRSLVHRLYELRKKDAPPLSGAEMLGITTAALLMPKEEFNAQLHSLLPYLEKRKVKFKKVSPRILVSSDRLDNPEYLQAVEESGCLIAMDDLDTGSRHFWNEVTVMSASSPTTKHDMLNALARRYLMQPASPRMMDWHEQVLRVIEWARDFNIQGVLELPQGYSRYREFRDNYFRTNLEKAGIPVMSFRREYYVANTGQLKTRAGAFTEMLEAKA